MLTGQRLEKLKKAHEKDPKIFTPKDKVYEALGENPDYLLDVHGITKSDLIRLERNNLAVKARYATEHPKYKMYYEINKKFEGVPGAKPLVCKTGPHRVRWIIFTEALGDNV